MRFLKRPYLGKTNLNIMKNYYLSVGLLNFFNQYFFRKDETDQVFSNLLYKCPELKSKDFKSQEKRERKIGKSVGVHAVGGWGGGLIGRKKE
jgi:hypothetical protein